MALVLPMMTGTSFLTRGPFQSASSSQTSLSAEDVAKPIFPPDVVGDYSATLTVSDGTDDDSKDMTIVAMSPEPKYSTTELHDNISEDMTLKTISAILQRQIIW